MFLEDVIKRATIVYVSNQRGGHAVVDVSNHQFGGRGCYG
jgi:hypothetical protein